MRKRFCPKCGVTITEGVLCSSCSKKELPIFEIPLIQVSEFQRVFTKGVWKQFRDLEELIILRVKEVVGKQVPIKVEPFEFIPRNKEKIILHVIATINEQKVRIPVNCHIDNVILVKNKKLNIIKEFYNYEILIKMLLPF